jgi:predicted ATPase/DNA-binding SARP family transcriptional activator
VSGTLIGQGLRIDFLGQPRFFFDGQPFAFHARPRCLALLGFLLLHRGAHLTRDVVAFTLWPDDFEEEARGKLRRHIYQTNAALPPSAKYIVSEGETVAWNPGAPIWFDVDEFERSCANEKRWEEAVELYRGDLLPTIYDDWIFPIRERLRREYFGVAGRLLIRARSRRDFSAAAAYAESILTQDAWREDILRQLASIRYESGDRAGAVREIDLFAQRLRDEMSVEVMPETAALRALMLRGAALPDAAASEPPDQVHLTSIVPFVGRAAELEQLATAWRRAARGRGEVVLIGGEAGIGKTRLVNELALRAAVEGGRVLRGGTSSPEKTPYQPIVEALRDAVPFLAETGVGAIWLSAISALVPELGLRRSDLPPLPVLDAARERSRLLESLAASLHGISRQRPLLLVLEDVQWAGEATLGALEYLARRAAAMPVLIVATYRSEPDEGRLIRAVRRKLQLENILGHVWLGGLSPEAVCELARSVPELADIAEEFALHVHGVTGGNPLFAIEMLNERAESGTAQPSSSSLRAMIAVRTRRMGENARRVSEIASVAGAAFETDLLCEISGMSEDFVLDAMGELLERGLVRDVGRVRFAFTFSHELIASAIYDGIEPQRRAQWHRRTARAVEKLTGAPPELAATLAFHYDRAGRAEEAAANYLAAAERAFSIFANQEALAGASRGLELTADPLRRYRLLALRERIFGRLGDRDAQHADIEELERLAPDDDARANVLWRRALHAYAVRELTGEAAYLEAFERYARDVKDAARQAAAQRASAQNLLLRSRYDEAAAAASSALETYRVLGDAEGEVESLCLLSEIAVNHGEAELVDETLARARESAESRNDPLLILRVVMTSAAIAINRRNFVQGLADAREAQRRYREIGDREGEAEATVRVGSTLSFLQRFDEARTEFDAAAKIYRDLGSRLQLAYLLFNQTGNQIQLGLLDDARSTLSTALEIFEVHDDLRGRAACLTNLSMVRLLEGVPHEAKELGEEAAALARKIGNQVIEAGALANLGNAQRELGELDMALAHMRQAIAIRERLGRPGTFEELGDLALAQLRAGDAAALDTANAIMDRADESGENTVWPHCCFWAAARVYHAHGDDAKAAQALRRSEALVEEQLEAMVDGKSHAAFAKLGSVRAVRAASKQNLWPQDP